MDRRGVLLAIRNEFYLYGEKAIQGGTIVTTQAEGCLMKYAARTNYELLLRGNNPLQEFRLCARVAGVFAKLLNAAGFVKVEDCLL